MVICSPGDAPLLPAAGFTAKLTILSTGKGGARVWHDTLYVLPDRAWPMIAGAGMWAAPCRAMYTHAHAVQA